MNAEHRKELETNALADKLGNVVHGLQEGPSRTTIVFASAAALVVVLGLAWYYFAQSARAADSQRWLQLDAAERPDDLEAVVKEGADLAQGRLARFELARYNFYQGLRGLGQYSLREESLKRIRTAADLYEKLIRDAASTPYLYREALLNAGKARESLGELDKAKDHYARLTKDAPDSLAGKQAAKHLEGLEKSGKELELLRERLVEGKALLGDPSPPVSPLPPLPSPFAPTTPK
jgi:tetratricopeptide (TPR) repeat protein